MEEAYPKAGSSRVLSMSFIEDAIQEPQISNRPFEGIPQQAGSEREAEFVPSHNASNFNIITIHEMRFR